MVFVEQEMKKETKRQEAVIEELISNIIRTVVDDSSNNKHCKYSKKY